MATETHNKDIIERLFKAGAHFGFRKSRRHPTVRPYLFTTKDGTDIFDLEKTAASLAAAKEALTEAGKNGKVMVCVGTKDEASKIVNEIAVANGLPYVTNRWIGGMLTNFGEIKKRIARLLELTAEAESGELERKYTKKERVVLGREMDKLEFNFGGIKTLERTPEMLIIVDPRHDKTAVSEARELGIKTVGLMSSDSNVESVTYPIVVNDALSSSIALVFRELVDAYVAGRAEYTPKQTTGSTKARTFVRGK